MPHNLLPRPRHARRALTAVLVAACATTMTACGSSTKHATAAAGTSPAATSSAASVSPTPSAGLSKAEFITKADAICTKMDAQLSALPHPAGDHDYAAGIAELEGTVALFKTYIAQVQPLVDQSADAAELNSKWLTVEKADFAQAEPLIGQMVAAMKAKNDALVASVGAELDALPDHTKDYVAVLTSYGLTSCAKLEDDSSNA